MSSANATIIIKSGRASNSCILYSYSDKVGHGVIRMGASTHMINICATSSQRYTYHKNLLVSDLLIGIYQNETHFPEVDI